jgi:hypothetical protein
MGTSKQRMENGNHSNQLILEKLAENIPFEIKKRIVEIASSNEIKPVYRVDKKGDLSEEFLWSSFKEFPGRFDETRPGTYSTSVYDVPDPCDRFIKSLKGKIREKYPRPVIRIGQTGHGLSVHTMDYDDDYTDPNHIDWWIFKEEMQEAARAFEVYDGTQNMEQ